MNKDNAKDYLLLVQALAEGKTIQHEHAPGDWSDLLEPHFDRSPEKYRIKREPREWTVWEEKTSGLLYSVSMDGWHNYRKIKVREVIE